MLSDWLSEDGRKAIEKMGWPEWEHEHDAESLQRLVLIEIGDGTRGWSFDKIFTIDRQRYIRNEECPARAALALLRDRARKWLEANTDGWSGGLSSGGYAIETYDADTNKWTLHSTPTSDWDGCLIIAVLATEKK